MGKLVDGLLAYLARTSKEQLEKDWIALEKYNDFGPEVNEFIKQTKSMKKEKTIIENLEQIDGLNTKTALSSLAQIEGASSSLKFSVPNLTKRESFAVMFLQKMTFDEKVFGIRSESEMKKRIKTAVFLADQLILELENLDEE